MKLWQKSFFITSLLFTGVLFLCAALLVIPAVRRSLLAVRDGAFAEERAIAEVYQTMFLASGYAEEPAGRRTMQTLAERYAETGTRVRLTEADRVLVDTAPEGKTPVGLLQWRMQAGRVTIGVGDALPNGYDMQYETDVTDRVLAAAWEGLFVILLSLLLCIGMDIVLYETMLRINRPLRRLAHELRTPLTALRGYGELLAIGSLNEEQRHAAASYIVSECDRMRDVAERILAADGKPKAQRERIPMGRIAERLRMTWDGIAVETEGDALVADANLLSSLLDNLIGNAQKAGGTVTVRLSPSEILVRDDGCGMDEALLAYVNDPEHVSRPSGIRSGLGVPFCHQLAAENGAVLRYASEPGKGTAATIQFTTLQQLCEDSETPDSVEYGRKE